MNYEELKTFIYEQTGATEAVMFLDNAIEDPTAKTIGLAINAFTQKSASYEIDGIFARELVEYIDGLKENQDNGESVAPQDLRILSIVKIIATAKELQACSYVGIAKTGDMHQVRYVNERYLQVFGDDKDVDTFLNHEHVEVQS